jgi:hypothetical protein
MNCKQKERAHDHAARQMQIKDSGFLTDKEFARECYSVGFVCGENPVQGSGLDSICRRDQSRARNKYCVLLFSNFLRAEPLEIGADEWISNVKTEDRRVGAPAQPLRDRRAVNRPAAPSKNLGTPVGFVTSRSFSGRSALLESSSAASSERPIR